MTRSTNQEKEVFSYCRVAYITSTRELFTGARIITNTPQMSGAYMRVAQSHLTAKSSKAAPLLYQ